MNSTPTACFLAAALFLGTPGFAQSSTSIVIVVRHDPGLVQLHPEMLVSLMSSKLLGAALDEVDGVAEDATPEITVDFQALADDAPAQPPGVLVTRLYAHSEDLRPAQLEQYARAVIDGVAGALRERLVDTPRQRLTAELRSIEDRIRAVAKSNMERDASGAIRAKREDARARAEALEAELATEQRVTDSLTAQLAEATAAADEARARSRLAGYELAIARHRLQQLAAASRESKELHDEVQRLESEIADKQSAQENREARATAAAERVSQFAATLDEARLRATRLVAQLDGLRKTIRTLEEHGDSEPAPSGPLAARELGSLYGRRERLIERLAELRPVEVEVWR